MRDGGIVARILEHLAGVPEDAVFERTLDCIALAAGCSRQYAGRILETAILGQGLARRERLAKAHAAFPGEPEVRRGTWLHYLTPLGARAARRFGTERHAAGEEPRGAFGRRFSDPVLDTAIAHERSGRYPQAERMYRRALTQRGPGARRAFILTRLSAIRYDLSDYRGALGLLGEARKHIPRDDAVLQADLMVAHAIVLNDLFQTREARALLVRARDRYRAARDVLGEGVAAHNLAYSYGNEGRVKRMLDGFQGAMALFEAAGDREWIAFELWTIAYHTALHRRPQDALPLVDRGLELNREIGDTLSESRALYVRGVVLQRLGRREEARRAYRMALALAVKLGNRREVTSGIHSLAKLAIEEGDAREASKLLDRLVVLVSHPEFRPTRRWLEIGVRR